MVAAMVQGDVVRFRRTSVFRGPGLVQAWHPRGRAAACHCTGSGLRLPPVLALPLTSSVTLSKLQTSPVHGMRTTRCLLPVRLRWGVGGTDRAHPTWSTCRGRQFIFVPYSVLTSARQLAVTLPAGRVGAGTLVGLSKLRLNFPLSA